jgi:hypothetical protein
MTSILEEARQWFPSRRSDFLQYVLPGAMVLGVLWKVATGGPWERAFSLDHVPLEPTRAIIWLAVVLTSAFLAGFAVRHAVVPFWPRRWAHLEDSVHLQEVVKDARVLRDFLARRRSPEGSRLYTRTISLAEAEEVLKETVEYATYCKQHPQGLRDGPLAQFWNATMDFTRAKPLAVTKRAEPDDAMPVCWLLKGIVSSAPPEGHGRTDEEVRDVAEAMLRALTTNMVGLQEARLIDQIPADALEMLVERYDRDSATMSPDRIRSCVNEVHGRYLPQFRDQFEPTIERLGLAECMTAATAVAALLLIVPWHGSPPLRPGAAYLFQCFLPATAAGVGSFLFLTIARREHDTLIRNVVRALAVWD